MPKTTAKQLYVPQIGDVLELAKPWTFTVIAEHRNAALIGFAGMMPANANYASYWTMHHNELGSLTFDKGTNLAVDRIYIRQGKEQYSSITFRATKLSKAAAVEAAVSGGTGSMPKAYFGRKGIRFWVRLADANTIVFKQ